MLNIQLGDRQLPRVTYDKDGTKRDIRVAHNTLFEFLQQNCFKDDKKRDFTLPIFETPALPMGTVKYMALPDGKVALFMEQKEFQHNVKYHGTTFEQVPFPNLLFFFVFQPRGDNYVLTTKRVFAFRDKVFRDTTQLYRFPYSHVQQNGYMCYFSDAEIQDLAQMSTFIFNWYNAEFSDHYYDYEQKNLWKTSLREVFTMNQNKRFDYSKLIPDITPKHLVSELVKAYFPEEQVLDNTVPAVTQ